MDLKESEREVVISLRNGEETFLECHPEENGDGEAGHEGGDGEASGGGDGHMDSACGGMESTSWEAELKEELDC